MDITTTQLRLLWLGGFVTMCGVLYGTVLLLTWLLQHRTGRALHNQTLASDPAQALSQPRVSVPLLRIVKARAVPGCERALAEKFATTSPQLVRDQPGLLGFLASGPANDATRDFVFATMWRDADALKACFGQEWHVSLLPPGYSELIESCSVEHYQLTEEFRAKSNHATLEHRTYV